MQFLLKFEVSYDLFRRFQELNDLSDQLKAQFEAKRYTNVKSCLINLHCISPKFSPNAKQFHTGYVLDKKYTSSKKHLEFTVKLKFDDIQNEESLKPSIIKALRGSVDSINELNIANFDMSVLVNDITLLLDSDIKEIEMEHVEALFNPSKERKEIPSDILMEQKDFWKLIDQANKEAGVGMKVAFLIDRLSKLELKAQYGFELTLRKLLNESNHYNMLGLAKVMLGMVSDDSFLYFRCRLILLGKDYLEMAINNPDDWNLIIDEKLRGEELLSVADRAFFIVNGEGSRKETPRDYAREFIDYDEGQELLGEEWDQEELPLKFPKLWKKYSNLN